MSPGIGASISLETINVTTLEIRRACLGCEMPIEPRSHRGRVRQWCSKPCWRASYKWVTTKEYKPLSCRNCKAHLGPDPKSVYCSDACREAGKRRSKTCVICSAEFFDTWERPRGTCSDSCAHVRQTMILAAARTAATSALRPTRPCGDCGTPTTRNSNRPGGIPLCGSCAKTRRRAFWRRKNVVRRGAAVVGSQMSIEQLGDRDKWTCHLCRKRVGRRLKSPHPRSATFDHLIPIADGGTDAPENLALAHRVCNTRRGTGGTVQLLLIG